MKKKLGKENSTMHTYVIRKSPCVAPNFCGYCACRYYITLYYIHSDCKITFMMTVVMGGNKVRSAVWKGRWCKSGFQEKLCKHLYSTTTPRLRDRTTGISNRYWFTSYTTTHSFTHSFKHDSIPVHPSSHLSCS